MLASVGIGVDVGGTSIKFGVVARDGTILLQSAVATNAESGPDGVLQRIADGIQSLMQTADYTVTAIGLGLPGVVNSAGDVAHPPNFRGWEIIPVAQRLRPLLDTTLPIAVENDANVAAYAELAGGTNFDERDFLFITLGTGVGGCIISDGNIWHGESGGAGEVGHISVDLNGQLCNCGSRGCVEAYLGQRYMSALAAARLQRFPESSLHHVIGDGSELEPRLIDEAARAGDPFAQDFLSEMGTILGAALASALNLCDLKLVIVGGGLSKSEEHLLEPARRSMRARVLKSIAPDVQLLRARHQNDAGIIGAALLGMR